MLLTTPGQQNIWVAFLIFANSPDNEITTMDEKASLTIEKVGNYTNSPFDQLEEVAYYEGKENPVTYMREFSKDFSCDFQLFTYPFDTQVTDHQTADNQTEDHGTVDHRTANNRTADHRTAGQRTTGQRTAGQ